jgi:hypothetical protein
MRSGVKGPEDLPEMQCRHRRHLWTLEGRFGGYGMRPYELASQSGAIAITCYKPTSRYLCACPDLDYFGFADHPLVFLVVART